MVLQPPLVPLSRQLELCVENLAGPPIPNLIQIEINIDYRRAQSDETDLSICLVHVRYSKQHFSY